MSLMRASVTSTSPMRVRVDGAANDGPAEAPGNVTFAVGQRVVVDTIGRSLIVLASYASSTTPVGQTVYLKSPNGTIYRLTVTDSGVLGTSTNL